MVATMTAPPLPQLILLPGLLNDAELWRDQIADLSDVARCWVPDLTQGETIRALAESVLAQAEPTFALAGFSMGGYVAFEVMRRAAHRVERLALIDTQATPDSPEATARRHGLIEQTKIGRFHGVQPSLLPMILHPSHIADPAIAQPILDMALEVGAEGFVNETRATMERPDSRHLLVNIDVPTVVIVGRQDLTTPLARSQEMAADISTSRLVVLEDCGHMAPLERPAEVSAELRRWLST